MQFYARFTNALNINALLLAAMVTPVLYFALLFIAGAYYPDYSHIRQVASVLGADEAPYGGALALNAGLMGVGIVGCAGSAGIFAGLRRAGANTLLAAVTAAMMAAPLINFFLSGLWPLPDPRHSSVVLVLTGFFAPIVAAATLWSVPQTRGLKIILIACFILTLAAFNGLGGLGTPELAGLRWRLIALFMLGALAALSWRLRVPISS